MKEVQDKQVFGKSSIPTDPKEVFAGDETFYKTLEDQADVEDIFVLPSQGKSAGPLVPSGATGARLGKLKIAIIILIAIVALGLIVPVSLYCFSSLMSPPQQTPVIVSAQPAAASSSQSQTQPQNKDDAAQKIVMDDSVSWKMAQAFYQNKEYAKASTAYSKLLQNLSRDPSHEIIRDFLHLRIALCSQQTGDTQVAEAYFNRALRSQAPSVVALTSYHMAFMLFASKNYAEARTKAYQTLAIVETIERPYCDTFINNCCYLIAQSLTAQSMLYESEKSELPENWPTVKFTEPFDDLDEAGLLRLLSAGSAPLRSAVLGPQVQKIKTSDKMQRWFVKAYRAPIEEVYVNFASAGGPEMHWSCEYAPVHNRAITLYLPAVTEQKFAEIATGAAGLLASFESKKTLVYNPETYSSVMERKALLTGEALASWQRFIFSYPKDRRLSDAHFAMGVLQSSVSHYISAIGEFKQVANNYSQSEVAPYALYNSGKIQLGLKDYSGAKQDLKELTVQYAESPLSDRGNILLAQTSMAVGDFESAQFVFRKIYNLEVPADQKLAAAMGAAKSYYALGDYTSSSQWFENFISYAKSSKLAHPADLQEAYLMLAQSNGNLGKYDEACNGYKLALANSASPAARFEITTELIRAFMKRQMYVEALETLETINIIDLTAEQTCRLWTAKASIYRAMNLPEQGLTILTGKTSATTDLQVKSEMMLEIAQCYNALGDYTKARTLLCDVIVQVPQSSATIGLQCDLAEICLKMKENQQAISVCGELLKQQLDNKNKDRIMAVLGQAYTNLKQYDKAAMVYGRVGDKGVSL